ncbi:hypothetical protein PAUR_a2193 [Pseudoalteromonas aurantia 208]|uniref:Uncharacterized protein n=1 Tax=Pseudoalteromonas aurantia 208 TaxID=1314867 RepID=A0ABR9EC49_9GAMM|nr:hypothetical protein [Pseudoalteromonas aurantia 208]
MKSNQFWVGVLLNYTEYIFYSIVIVNFSNGLKWVLFKLFLLWF